jgi:hypothetical protein
VILVLVVALTGFFRWWRLFFRRNGGGLRGGRIVGIAVAAPAAATGIPVAAAVAAVAFARVPDAVAAVVLIAIGSVVGAAVFPVAFPVVAVFLVVSGLRVDGMGAGLIFLAVAAGWCLPLIWI